MRKTFYELLASRSFSVWDEYQKLMNLFYHEYSVATNGYYGTVARYIDAVYYRDLSFRGTTTSLNELMSAIALPPVSDELNDLFLLCEFLMAILPDNEIKKDRNLLKQANTIFGNIFNILERTNHELKKDKNGNLIVVAKNQAAVLAAEIAEDENVAFDLIEYNHYALKGNLSEKKKILSSIGLYIEPILKNRALQDTMYKQLLSDTGFVFNNFHIRHNNLTGPKAQDYLLTLDENELEKWYDRAYELAIAVIISASCLPTHQKLEVLKKNHNWKT